MAEIIKTIQLKQSDGTLKELTFAGLKYLGETDNGNLEIGSPYPTGNDSKVKGGKLNIEPRSNLAIKPADAVQLHTEKYVNQMQSSNGELSFLGNDADCSEFKINVINDNCDSSNCVEGLQINTAGLKFMTKDAHETDESVPSDEQYDADGNLFSPALSVYKGTWDDSKFPLQFKKNKNEWTKLNVHAKAIDIRARALSAGTGGGIAVQIASCDDDGNENKFKIETSRVRDVFDTTVTTKISKAAATWGTVYQGEGGTGIEIGTVNSQVESFHTSEMRRAAETKLFACERVFEPAVTVHFVKTATNVMVRGTGGVWQMKSCSTDDNIMHVESGMYAGWYYKKSCKPENQIMASATTHVENGTDEVEGTDYVSNNGTKYDLFSTEILDSENVKYLFDGDVVDENTRDKWDYLTQDDDTKDHKLNQATSLYTASADDTVYWIDLINTALYLKREGKIPNNQKLIGDPSATYTA